LVEEEIGIEDGTLRNGDGTVAMKVGEIGVKGLGSDQPAVADGEGTLAPVANVEISGVGPGGAGAGDGRGAGATGVTTEVAVHIAYLGAVGNGEVASAGLCDVEV